MEKISELFNNWLHEGSVVRLIIILFGILLSLLVSYYLKKVLSVHISDSDKKYRLRKGVNFFSYILIISIVLFVYNDKLGNVGIALGLAGAGITFALQEVITSLAGWISIMTSNSIRIGDRVKIGEIKGDVIDIGVLKTTLMELGGWIEGDLYNGRITQLANSFVFKEPLQNYSSDYPFLWDEINVPIRTESDFNLARKIFREVADEVCGAYSKKSEAIWVNMTDKYRVENADVQPLVTLEFDENWINFTIRYVVDFKVRRSTKDRLFTRLLEEIRKYDGVIMIATTSVEVTNVSPTETNK